MFAFSLGPLSLDELEALEAKEKEAKPSRAKGKGKAKSTVARKPKATASTRATKR
jgi:hypothetical protein